VPITPPFCDLCGMPAIAIEGPCGTCRTGGNSYDFARSAVFFTNTAREIVHHLKYLDRVSLAKPLGEMLADVYRNEGFTADAIVPVPLHPARERIRGFNQAERIARHIGPPVFSNWVRRKRKTATQTGLTRSQRKENLSGAFKIVGEIRGRRILIVDDVLTTGATVNEIAKVLKRGGAERVEVLTVARVPDDISPPQPAIAA
jgi:ComF family protein